MFDRTTYSRNYMREHPQKRTPEQKQQRTIGAQKREKEYYATLRWNSHLKKKFGITADQYNRLLAAQGGHCVFCHRIKEENGNRLAVDHDKQTNRVRGILCLVHNAALGALGDNEIGIRKALEYVKED